MAETLTVLETGKIQTYLLGDYSSWLIGRQEPTENPGSNIVLASRTASREHGWLHNIEGQWFYVDNPENKNGTYFNGRKLSRPLRGIKQPVPLNEGDILRIDGASYRDLGVTMLFSAEQILGQWRNFALHDRDITIGSGKDCELIIRGFGLRDKQAKLTNVNGEYYLSACNMEIVLLNRQQVKENTLLQYGDHIQMNGCHIFFLGEKLVYTKIVS